MTVCELLEDYDSAVRPFGNNPNMEKSNLIFNNSNFQRI